jgi:uncharacterized membrane protein (UPF0127 family)
MRKQHQADKSCQLLGHDNGSEFRNKPRLIAGTEQRRGGKLEKQKYCVYNQTRECFLSLSVTRADTTFARLKGLIGRLKLRYDEGVWMVPSSGIHSFGVLFPLDLIYLDENHCVIHLVEFFRTFRIAPLRVRAASVLQLPIHTIYSSQTQQGDQLLICPPEEMECHLSEEAVSLGIVNEKVG